MGWLEDCGGLRGGLFDLTYREVEVSYLELGGLHFGCWTVEKGGKVGGRRVRLPVVVKVVFQLGDEKGELESRLQPSNFGFCAVILKTLLVAMPNFWSHAPWDTYSDHTPQTRSSPRFQNNQSV